MHTRTRPHVNAMVGRTNHVFVMLNHQHAVADIAQMFQGVNQSVVVALVQTDAGFIQHIHHARETGTDLRGQSNTLRLTPRQGIRAARKAQIGEAHIVQKFQTVGNFTHHLVRDIGFVAIECELLEIVLAFRQGEMADIVHRQGLRACAQTHMAGLGAQARAGTSLT